MLKLIAGLVLFYLSHASVFARAQRERLRARLGDGLRRGLVSLLALAGVALIVWGFADYRAGGYVQLWDPPVWARHLAFLLMLPAFIMLAAAFAPGHIKARLGHPMLAAVKTWALAHLLANGDLGSIILFGSFLAWGVAARVAARRRGERAVVPAPSWRADAIAVIAGAVAWWLTLTWLHAWLTGVPLVG